MLFAATAACGQTAVRLSQADCRAMAVSHNEDLKRAANAARQAGMDKDVARAAYLPTLDAMGTAAYVAPDFDMMGMDLQMRGTYLAGITLTQPLYAGGKIRAGKRLADIGWESAQDNLRLVKAQAVAEADKAYWSLIAVRWKVRMLDAYKAQVDTLYRQVEASLAAGMATEGDLLRVAAKRSEIAYQRQKAANGANLCRMALCSAVGLPMDSDVLPTDTAIDVHPTALPDTSIALRPELSLMRHRVEAADEQVKVARADILPSVGLSAGYCRFGNVKLKGVAADAQGNYHPFTQSMDEGMATVMASVSVPLFRWGAGLKKVRKAKLDAENARLELQKNARLMGMEAQQAAQNVADGQAMAATARLGLAQAEENLRTARSRYAGGLCLLSDLMDAQSQWQQAQGDLIEALTQCKIYETEWLLATGRID